MTLGGASDRATLLAVGLPGFPDWSEVEEHTALFGAGAEPPEIPASKHQAGAVYLFERRRGDRWQPQATLRPAGWETPPGPSTLFAGPPSTSEAGDGMLAAIDAGDIVFPGHILSEEPEVTFFGASVDLDGEQLAVTAGLANGTYLFQRRDSEWVYRASLKPRQEKPELVEDYAQTVTLDGDTLLLGTPGEFGNSAYVFDLQAVRDAP